jgi:hypothetical protein
MTMKVAALVLLAAGGVTAAQEAADKAQKPQKPATPLKVQVVFSRYQAEKKIASVHYTLPVNADDSRGRIYMGVQIPLRYESKESYHNVAFKNAGNSVDCGAQALDGGRFKLSCEFTHSSVFAEEPGPAPTRATAHDGTPLPPVLKTFESSATFFLRDGQTAQHMVATDPVNGDVLRVDVTLAVVK